MGHVPAQACLASHGIQREGSFMYWCQGASTYICPRQERDTEGEPRSLGTMQSDLCPHPSSLPFEFALRKGKRTEN